MISKVKYQAENKGLKIKLCEYKKVLIPVDKDNFERAISNIIQNAIKYTNQGTITIDAREENKKVTITISDTGVGIDQKDLPYIFDRFYKAEHSRNDNSSSGLGLSIAKLIIEEHKGSIGIESEVNRGTVAIITMSTK
jgi:signal transduction histidine kinase